MTDELIRKSDALELFDDWWLYAPSGQQVTSDVCDAIAALPAVTVGVKPLVWFEAELPSRGGGKYTAEGYTIRKIEGLWLLDFAGEGRSKWRWIELDAAKAAAQADYEARILAALTPTPVDDSQTPYSAIKALDDLARLGQEYDAAPATHLHANKGAMLAEMGAGQEP